jgi:diguanylate cyclase (GGDEF)-like protein
MLWSIQVRRLYRNGIPRGVAAGGWNIVARALNRLALCLGLAALASSPAIHASFPEGAPPVVRLTPDIGAFPQTFDVSEGSAAVYVAGMDGVLSYDGQRWSLLRLPNEDNVQSLDYDGKSRIYLGGTNQIGYFDTEDPTVFHDLTPLVESRIGDKEFGSVLQTLATSDGVFFKCNEYLFRYDPGRGTVESWQNPGHSTQVAFGGMDMYRGAAVVQFRGVGLRQYRNDQWLPVSDKSEVLDPVVALSELPDGGLLLFSKDGPWQEWINDEVHPYAMPDGVPAQPLSCATATKLHDGVLAMACDDGVLRLVDTQAHRLHSIPISETALTGVSVANDGGVLVTDNESLYYVPWPPRWSIVGPEDGLRGDVHRLRRWGDRWVALSNNGIYVADGGKNAHAPAFRAAPYAEGDSWDLLGIDADTALATVNDKVSIVHGDGSLRAIDGPPLDAKLILRSERDASIVYVCGDGGMWILQGHGADWRVVEARLHQPDAVNTLLEEGDRQLWIGTDRAGVHRLTLSPDRLHVVEDRAFGAADGIHYGKLGEAELFRWKDGSVIATTRTGQYRWAGSRFEADPLDGLSALNDPKLTLDYVVAPNGDEWADNGRHLYHRSAGQPWHNETVPGMAQGGIEAYAFDEQGSLLLTGASKIVRYDARIASTPATWKPSIRLHAIEWGGPDAKDTHLPLHPDAPPQLLMGDFSLDFQVSLPEFRTDRPTLFSDQMSPVEKDFGLWSINPRTGWSQMSPGEYTYVARAIDADGNITQTEPYHFVILSPWYKRSWAFALWAILLLSATGAFAVGLTENRTRRLRALTVRLETMVAERTRALAEANTRLEQLALMDSLTEVANRRGLDVWLRESWQRCIDTGKPMAIIVIDIDHFKSINDRLGHVGGDELLKKVSQILTSCLRRSEDRIGRYGGDEFVVGLPGADIELGAEIAETMRSRIEASGLTTISVGVAARQPRLDEPVVALLNEADTALYKCKQGGRNRVFVEYHGIDGI